MQANHPVVMSVKYTVYFDPTSESSSASASLSDEKFKIHRQITVIKLLNKGLLCLKFRVTLAKL